MKLSFQNNFFRYRQLWAFLSLCSLIALALPQVAWACSITGQVARTPVLACPCTQQSSQKTSEETPIHRCCNALPLPASSADEHGLKKALIPARSSGELTPDSGTDTDNGLFLGASIFQLKEPRLFFVTSSFLNPPRLNSQHSSRSYLGRAPPF